MTTRTITPSVLVMAIAPERLRASPFHPRQRLAVRLLGSLERHLDRRGLRRDLLHRLRVVLEDLGFQSSIVSDKRLAARHKPV